MTTISRKNWYSLDWEWKRRYISRGDVIHELMIAGKFREVALVD